MGAIRLETEDGLGLEGELRLPAGPPRGAAVVCHPDPKAGGSKDHPLLWALRTQLTARGFAVLGFNFRGVMGSEGTHTGGQEEAEDVRAAVDRAVMETREPTVVVGWSFGANVALRHAIVDRRVAALALVGLPLGQAASGLPPLPDEETLRAFTTPVILVAGDGDAISPVPDLQSVAAAIPRGETWILPGADHFFARREDEPARAVGEFFERALRA